MKFSGHIYSFPFVLRQLPKNSEKEDISRDNLISCCKEGTFMFVKEIMTPNVVTIGSRDTVLDACQKYKDLSVGCLVVMNDRIIVGILTERDIIERIIVDQRNPKRTKVEDIMTKNIKTIHASARIEQAAEMMKTYKIKKLPVVLNNEIMGIITATDITNNMPEFTKELKKLFLDEKPFRIVQKPPYVQNTTQNK